MRSIFAVDDPGRLSASIPESIFPSDSTGYFGGESHRLLHHWSCHRLLHHLPDIRARVAVVHHHRFLRRTDHLLDLLSGSGDVDAIGTIDLRAGCGGSSLGRFAADDLRRHRNCRLAQRIMNLVYVSNILIYK